jgi:hypothetical protein
MAQDARRESWLRREGVDFVYHPFIPLEKFDVERSLQNQARLERPLIPEVVEEYARALRDGAQFPAVVCYATATGYVLIDRNHRLAAARRVGLAGWDAYEVLTQDKFLLECLTRTANILEGVRATPAERLEQAAYLAATYGAPIRVLAQRFALDEDRLAEYLRERRARERLLAQGVSDLRLPGWHLARLNAIENDHVLREAALLAQRAALQAHARFCAWAAETARRAAAARRARLRLWAAVEARLQAVGVPGNIRHRIGEWLVDTPQSWDLETVEAVLEALCAEPWLPRGVGVGTRRRLLALAGGAGENGRWPTLQTLHGRL